MFDSTSRPTFRPISRRWLVVLTALFLMPPSLAGAGPILFTAAGNIQGTVDDFRAALGDPLNGNTPGAQPAGRREINWDGGGAALNASPAGTPFAGFQNRGAIFETPGTGFQQAQPTASPLPLEGLAELFGQPGYATDFVTFSAFRLFVPVDSNITDALFSVPGSMGTLPAGVGGFGAVFTDVDLEDTTSIEFFNASGLLIGSVFAPASNGGLSFAGIKFDAGELATRVRITTGNAALGVADTGGVDVVAMDDFLFQEPVPIPEPATLLLTAMGLLAGGRALRRRGRSGPES